MRGRRLGLGWFGFAVAGCMTASGGLQTAHTLAPDHWQLTGGASVPVATRFVSELGDVVDQSVAAIDRATTGEPLSAEDERAVVVSALALVLFQPAPIATMSLRRGLLEGLDAGVRWAGPALRVDAKWQPYAPLDGPDVALELGMTHHTGVASSVASSVFDLFESLRLVSYRRQDIELGLLVSSPIERRLGWFCGARYLVGFVSIETALDEAVQTEQPPALREVDATLQQLGGSAGLRLALLFELTMMKVWFEPEVLGAPADLGGWIVEPGLGLSGSF